MSNLNVNGLHEFNGFTLSFELFHLFQRSLDFHERKVERLWRNGLLKIRFFSEKKSYFTELQIYSEINGTINCLLHLFNYICYLHQNSSMRSLHVFNQRSSPLEIDCLLTISWPVESLNYTNKFFSLTDNFHRKPSITT